MKKICIILGTRPEIIKLSPVINECKKRKISFFVVHTNQHYSSEMDEFFFKDLKLKKPQYNLNIGSGHHGEMTGRMLVEIEKVLIKEEPSIVLVQGDTNTVIAGALCASKLCIPIAHIEAGLRSHDRGMPEEINRIVVDHISDFLFVPTEEAKNNLIKEGIDKKKIFKVGNTIVDAVFHNLKIAKEHSSILEDLDLLDGEYALLTVHRPSNTDSKKYITSIFNGVKRVQDFGIEKIIFPAHPRVDKKIEEYKLDIPDNIVKIKPVGYLDMLFLIKNSRIIFTDSGGIQEEACVLNVPCITLRENTERPETLKVGCNVLVGSDEMSILHAVGKMIKKKRKWRNPFGDGKSATRIIDLIQKEL